MLYFWFNKKTGEYLEFSNTLPEDPLVDYTTEATDFILDAMGNVVEIPFREGATWIFKPNFYVKRPTEVYTGE